MKQLTEAQAWREIARRFAQGEDDGGAGMCWERSRLLEQHKISYAIDDEMEHRTKEHLDLDETTISYACARYFDVPGFANSRVLAALFLALEAEDEARAA